MRIFYCWVKEAQYFSLQESKRTRINVTQFHFRLCFKLISVLKPFSIKSILRCPNVKGRLLAFPRSLTLEGKCAFLKKTSIYRWIWLRRLVFDIRSEGEKLHSRKSYWVLRSESTWKKIKNRYLRGRYWRRSFGHYLRMQCPAVSVLSPLGAKKNIPAILTE